MFSFFGASFKGQASLAMAFWTVFFLTTIVLELVVLNLLAIFWPSLRTSPLLGSILSTILLPYIVFSAICVWRCAKNSNAIWRVIARILMVIFILGGIYNIFRLISYA